MKSRNSHDMPEPGCGKYVRYFGIERVFVARQHRIRYISVPLAHISDEQSFERARKTLDRLGLAELYLDVIRPRRRIKPYARTVCRAVRHIAVYRFYRRYESRKAQPVAAPHRLGDIYVRRRYIYPKHTVDVAAVERHAIYIYLSSARPHVDRAHTTRNFASTAYRLRRPTVDTDCGGSKRGYAQRERQEASQDFPQAALIT